MIRLTREPAPFDLDLGDGVVVTVKPLTYAVYRASVHAAERMATDLAHESGLIAAAGGSIRDIPDPLQRENFLGLRDQFMLQSLARHAITAWSGVSGEDGTPIPVTVHAIDAFVRDAVIHAMRFEARYMDRISRMISEGEGFGAAQNGTLAAAPTTADGAEKATIPAHQAGPDQMESAVQPA